MSHTLGPWTAEFSEDGGYDCMTSAWHIAGCAGRQPAPIATIDLAHYGQQRHVGNIPELSRATAEADARLIAAAPELLDALRAFCGDYECTPLQIPELQAAYRHALTIIAKAEGRS